MDGRITSVWSRIYKVKWKLGRSFHITPNPIGMDHGLNWNIRDFFGKVGMLNMNGFNSYHFTTNSCTISVAKGKSVVCSLTHGAAFFS